MLLLFAAEDEGTGVGGGGGTNCLGGTIGFTTAAAGGGGGTSFFSTGGGGGLAAPDDAEEAPFACKAAIRSAMLERRTGPAPSLLASGDTDKDGGAGGGAFELLDGAAGAGFTYEGADTFSGDSVR